MKNIIKFIIDQEHESTDTYLSMVEPISEKFEIDLEIIKKLLILLLNGKPMMPFIIVLKNF